MVEIMDEPEAQQHVVPDDIWTTYVGEINQANLPRLTNALGLAVSNNAKRIHMAFETSGGFVADGIFLYNLLRVMPFELTMYNCGSVDSIGIIAFLGAKNRKACANATF